MGPQMTRDLLRWNNTTAPVCARQSLIPMKNIPASLAPLDRAPGWFSVEGLLPLEEIKTGSLYVADPSTRYSIDLLAPSPERRFWTPAPPPAANPQPSSPLPEAKPS